MKVTGPAVLWERTSSDKAVRSFEDAYAVVSGQLSALAKDNPIFEAHLEMLQDPMVADTVQANMAAGMQPLKALDSAGNAIASMFAGIDDEYLAARVDDVRDIFRRLRDAMTGNSSPQAEFPEGGILVAEELLPSDTSKIDFSKVRGILCAKGSTTSHVCIIARSKGVPIRVGADISGIREGDSVEVEDPLVGGQEEVVSKLRAAGRKVYVNAGSISDIEAGIAAGADGVGLFRTEFLFIGRDSEPGAEEQESIYSQALIACGGKPLTLRTLDVGGDKRIPYIEIPAEENPFLGL
ncbi:MAG: phosphoenolpyruvate--protein phosphotransferase, partial [Bacteroidales bacterium]|nr:phosphoenolpyruvate--protein phosphotransferase [Bacteroidales bacterium]